MKFISNRHITDPTVNLALEEYCVRNLDVENDSYFLFYINEPSIIIGKHQNTIEEINSAYVKKHNIHVVRRISGGGAVYHDHGNLNFSFITKHTNDSINNFGKFTGPISQCLKQMGVNAELGGRNDITVEGRKISGNAQFTNTKSMFSHGTLLFDSHLENVVDALNVKLDKIKSKGIKSIRSRVANITEYLTVKITIEAFRDILTDYIFGGRDKAVAQVLSEDDWKKVYELSDSKYRTWKWNYGRSPEFNIQKVHRFPFGQIDTRIFVRDGVIKHVKIFGDYLGYGETEDIESLLIGIFYKEDKIKDVLKDIDMKFYFGDITVEEFVRYLFN
ncbi:MAG TPA: lipoate--protein ligase [Ignavibacteria bacterium]